MKTLIPDLEALLVEAASKETRRARPAWRRLRGRTRAVVLAAVLALAGAAVAAATVVSVGSTVPADKVPGKGEPQFINGRMIVAAGISPRVGRWRMYYASTNRGVCMGFEYVDTHSGLAEGCGNGGALTVGKWSIPHQEIALYGRAPAGASSIRVALRDGGVLRAQLFMAPEGIPGKFYFAGLPYERRPAAVQAFDKSDRPLGPLTDIP